MSAEAIGLRAAPADRAPRGACPRRHGILRAVSFFDKAKAAASQAAAKAKQGAEDLQLKVDLGKAYDDLGKAAYELIEQGELAHEKLEAPAAKVRELRERLDGDDGPEPPAEEVPAAPEAVPSDEGVASEHDTADAGEPTPGPDEPAGPSS